MLLPELQTAFRDAFARLAPTLAADPDELRARLARRRLKTFHRALRPWCIALRANDARINPYHAAITPQHALDPDSPFHPGQRLPHTVQVDARLVRLLCQRVDISAPGEPWYHIARRLGVKDPGLHCLRKHPAVEFRRIRGYAHRRGKPTPFLYTDSPLDPAARGKRPPDPIFGGLWAFLPASLPDSFCQTLTRMPRRLTRFSGWRWICPGCRQPARTLFYPLAPPDWSNLLDLHLPPDEAGLDTTPVPSFACHRCHDLVHFSRAMLRRSWNQLVLRLSGGLLYGREVTMPPSLTTQRKHAYSRRPRPAPRRDQLAHLLAATDLTFTQIANQLGLTRGSVRVIAGVIYQQHGVHGRHQLRALSPPQTPTSDLQPPNSNL
jgi:hypothetical protein